MLYFVDLPFREALQGGLDIN